MKEVIGSEEWFAKKELDRKNYAASLRAEMEIKNKKLFGEVNNSEGAKKERAWEKDINKNLKGKTIKCVRFMTNDELDEFGWWKKSLVIEFTDGSWLFPMSDDEGNDGGSLATSIKGFETIGTLRRS